MPRLPILAFEQGDQIVLLGGQHVPVNPLVQVPVVVPAPTHPAWFSVPRGHGQTLSAAHKLTRPGIPLIGTFFTRDGNSWTTAQQFHLHRPVVPPAGVRKLAITADADALAHLFLDVVPDQTAADFTPLPYTDDPDNAGYERNEWFDDEYDRRFREYRAGTGYELYRAPSNGELRLRILAHGLPGWRLADRAVPPAPPSAPYDREVPLSMAGAQSVYPARGALESWLTLRNERADGTLVAHDVALFTQAPFIVTSEIDPPERLFAVLMSDTNTENVENVLQKGSDSDEEEEEVGPAYGNFGTIADLCAIAAGVNVPVTLIPGAGTDEDVWAQDAVLLGSMHVPGKEGRAVVATNRRKLGISKIKAGLEGRLRAYQPDDKTGLFREILENVASNNSLDFGGNVIATPPIAEATDALEEDEGGPKVAAHPPAPYGKLLVGDDTDRRPTQSFRGWLHGQKAQPVLPISTSWLSVGHVDEILGIVPAPESERGWAVLFADPNLALKLYTISIGQANGVVGQATINPALYRTTRAGIDPDAHRWMKALAAIRTRVTAGLDLHDRDVIPMPVLYSQAHANASAVFPNLVNGLTLGNVAILPRPYGPRISVEKAAALLTQLPGHNITEQMVANAQLDELLQPSYWARRTVDDEIFPRYFAKAKEGHGHDKAIVTDAKRLIGAGEAIPQEIRPPGIDRVPNGWSLWSLTLTHVDIYEAYVKVRLSALGLQPYFIDNWSWYHSKDGELHCGTKVRRKPHVPDAGSRWWEVWPALLGVVPAAP